MSIHIPSTDGEALQAAVRSSLPDALPILPLRDSVPFPETLTPLAIGQERSIQLVNDVLSGDRMLVMLASKDPETEEPGPDDLYRVGVAGVVARMLKVPDGTLRILVHGAQRVTISDYVATDPYLVARIEEAPDQVKPIARARGAPSQRAGHLLADRGGGAIPARGAAGGAGERGGSGRAGPHDRGVAAHQDRGAPAAARGARRGQAPAPAFRGACPRARAGRDRLEDPVRGPVRHGEGAARVLPPPAAQGHPG